MKQFVCSTCTRMFTLHSVTRSAACPFCKASFDPTDQVSVRREGKGLVIEGKLKAKLAKGKHCCSKCKHVFEFDCSYGEPPKCPRCHTIGAEALTPTAFVFSQAARRENAKDRYLKRTGNLLATFREQTKNILATMNTLDVSKTTEDKLRDILQSALTEAETRRACDLVRFE